MDTRPGADNVGPRATPLEADRPYLATVWGTNGNCTIPTTAVGVVMNVTADNPTAGSYLSIYPADSSRPLVSSLNYEAKQPPTPNGVTVIVLQHRESGCMNMLHHFFGHRFELRQTMEMFRAKHGDRYGITTTLDPAHVETPNLTETYAVAEFMLNLLEINAAPTKRDVEAYVHANFTQPNGCFNIPVHQDFVEIRHGGKI